MKTKGDLMNKYPSWSHFIQDEWLKRDLVNDEDRYYALERTILSFEKSSSNKYKS